MRAREFITEQADLPEETKEPMKNTFVLPGLSASDPYKNYRFGVAMARARADLGGVTGDMPEFNSESALGMYGVIGGFDETVDPVIDLALKMTETPGGKIAVSSNPSEEPPPVNTVSPIRSFAGYPR